MGTEGSQWPEHRKSPVCSAVAPILQIRRLMPREEKWHLNPGQPVSVSSVFSSLAEVVILQAWEGFAGPGSRVGRCSGSVTHSGYDLRPSQPGVSFLLGFLTVSLSSPCPLFTGLFCGWAVPPEKAQHSA